MEWKVERVPGLDGYTVEFAAPGNFYLSRCNQLFQSAALKPPFKKVALIDAPFWKQAASRFRPAQRLLRFMVTNVVPLPGGDIFVTFDKTVGVIRDGKYRQLEGLKRPCRVLRSACAVDGNGNVFFGEYLANDERGPMHVYKFAPGTDSLEVVHTFPTGAIRHIHGVYFDPFTDSLFCLTGDRQDECRIMRTSDEFATIEILGSGDESWRAVSVLFSEDSIFCGTDAEFRANNIFRCRRSTGERTDLGEVNGTVFYSKAVEGELFFTTTAENAPSQKENAAAIWNVDGDVCREIVKFEKDRWHPTLFMFGTIHFPYENRLPGELYFSLVGVKGDNQTFRLRRV